ncbi:MAG: hypothetical protein HY689_04140, partial [Chloroflexi bacterium]|nr:hypothetical protein [Chloroflexota bacterium]
MASASADRPIRQALFLARYAQLGNLALAAEQAAVSKRVVHHWKATDPAFAEAFAEAQAQAVEVLEAEARRRAVEGVEEPVFQGGKQVGT